MTRGAELARTEEEVKTAFLTLIANAGNVRATCRQLEADHGWTVGEETLRLWRNERYTQMYRDIEEEYGKDVEHRMVLILRANAEQAAKGVSDTVNKIIKDIQNAPADTNPRDTANALLAVQKILTSSVDKVLALTGRPQSITEHRDPAKLLESMVARGFVTLPPAFDAEGTAEEVTNGNGAGRE